MKKILILSLSILLIGGMAYSQKKPNIGKAERERNNGNLLEAKEILDEIGNHPKTKDDGKAWYYKGLLYVALDTTTNPKFKGVAMNPLKTALEAFKKADELDEKEKGYFIMDPMGLPTTKELQLEMLYGHYINGGAEKFSKENRTDEDVKSAAEYFDKGAMVGGRLDSLGSYYAAVAYQTIEIYDEASARFQKHLSNGFADEDAYNSILYIEGTVKKDHEKALKIVRDAMKDFPNNTEYPVYEIEFLRNLGRVDEAIKQMEVIAKEDGKDPILFTRLALTYEEVDDIEKAKEAYKAALEIDPNLYVANYNMGALIFNDALNINKDIAELGNTRADKAKEQELIKERKVFLLDAVPYWEKARESEPEDQGILETLEYIYYFSDQQKKAEEIGKKLEALGYKD